MTRPDQRLHNGLATSRTRASNRQLPRSQPRRLTLRAARRAISELAFAACGGSPNGAWNPLRPSMTTPTFTGSDLSGWALKLEIQPPPRRQQLSARAAGRALAKCKTKKSKKARRKCRRSAALPVRRTAVFRRSRPSDSGAPRACRQPNGTESAGDPIPGASWDRRRVRRQAWFRRQGSNKHPGVDQPFNQIRRAR